MEFMVFEAPMEIYLCKLENYVNVYILMSHVTQGVVYGQHPKLSGGILKYITVTHIQLLFAKT